MSKLPDGNRGEVRRERERERDEVEVSLDLDLSISKTNVSEGVAF